MQRLGVSDAVRPIYESLGVKRLIASFMETVLFSVTQRIFFFLSLQLHVKESGLDRLEFEVPRCHKNIHK